MLENESRLLPNAYPAEARDSIKAFLDHGRIRKGWSAHRIYYYSVRLRITLECLGDSFLDPVPEDVTALISGLRGRGNSDRTVMDYLDAYRRFFRWRKGTLGSDPVGAFEFRSAKKSKRPEDLITSDEVQRLIDHATNDRDRALISLLCDGGCRISELLTMRKPDVNFDEHGMMIAVIGKTGYRHVYVIGKIRSVIEEVVAVAPGSPR
ncbi:hypothetical protein DMB44_03175 [Thermoplasma sp. Kam2015]|nr:tyrosine-type recombinase/integrase [Thermoplasma sp. Kam2015]PYB68622.1 hypothetical protein DMB44_03175 [Thermoplasma sp. Kam2015]